MARKRYKKRISQKDKQFLQSLEENAKKLEEKNKVLKCDRDPTDNDKDYLNKLNLHQEYLTVLHGRKSEDKGVMTVHRQAKARKNKRAHEKVLDRKKKIKLLQEERHFEKHMWEDKVEFDEVVLRPPTRFKAPRKAVSKKVEYGKLNFMKQFTSVGNQFTSSKS